ncbi:MAG TPA: histidine kinase [Ktedonobacterales bacterium]|nr:histidine kinase [Ktedonobacterales bacterium]
MHAIEETASREAAAGSHRPAYLASAAWLLWLPLLVPMILALLGTHPSPARLVLSLLGAAIFAGLYIWTALRNARRVVGAAPTPVRADLALWLPILVMLLLSLVLTEADGAAWGGLFIFTVAVAMGRLPTWQAAALLVGVALLTLFYGWRRHLPIVESLSNIFWLGLAGLATLTMVWSITTSRRLREEREELARFAAVTEERLRIARDLHDLLGHNLSLIALKSELAGRLIGSAPERAAAEIGDIERVARTALREVREAVASYRQPTMASELHSAREVLAAAGIIYRIEGATALGRLPAAVEGALAWTVREGVTNVVRHSRARSCTIWLRRAAETVGVEIADDGIGIAGTTSDGDGEAAQARYTGNGLRGVEERVVALAGRCEVGPHGGGFRLAVRVPVAPAALAEETSKQVAGHVGEPTAREADAKAIEKGAPR